MPDRSDSDSSPKSSSGYGSGEEAKPMADPGSPSNAQQSSDESCGSSDGVLVDLPGHQDQDSRGLRGDPDGGILVNADCSMQESADESVREETFEDAADDLAELESHSVGLEESMAVIEIGERSGGTLGDGHLAIVQARLEDAIAECRKFKEEREVLGREIVSLRKNLQDIFDHHSLHAAVENDGTANLPQLETIVSEDRALSSLLPLHLMLNVCSKLLVDLKAILDERIGSESLIRELHMSLNEKDRQIEDLNVKALESSVSHYVVDSYFGSVKETWSKYVEKSTDVTKRLLSSLGSVVGQGDASAEDSPIEDLFLVEKRILSLIDTHSQFLSEIHLLHQCLAEVSPASAALEDYEAGNIFNFAREQLFENKRKGSYLQEKIDRLEEENKKLIEEVEKTKMSLEVAHMETNKAKTEVQQAENKFMAAKEKLGIAVTKGKSLVQHRDSLKQFLAEKTSELEKCLEELQQKSEALQASEASLEELKQSLHERTSELEKCLDESQHKTDDLQAAQDSLEELKQSLHERTRELEKCLEESQHKTDDLQAAQDSLEELKQSLHERTSELEKCLEELQHKSDDLETAKASIDNLNSTFSVLNSLQESLSQKDKCLHEIEEVMLLKDSPEEMLSMETIDKIRWFINQKTIADAIVLENRKIRDIMSLIELPEEILSRELDYQINWLVTEFTCAKYNIGKLQDEINGAWLAMASQESEMLESHKGIDRLESYILAEKLAKESLHNELEELKCQYEDTVQKLSKASSDTEQLIHVLLELSESTLDDLISDDISLTAEKCMIKISEKMKSSLSQMEHLERMQSRLYLTDLQLKLHEKTLEDEMIDRSAMTMLTDELMKLSNDTFVLKNEKDSIQKELERSEEKNSLLREKLSMAVKKGKGLVQEREGLKLSLEEKLLEIENLKHELQLKDSSINEYQDQIKNFSDNIEHIEKIEANIVKLKDERDQIQQSFHKSSIKLKNLVTSIENIALPTVDVFEGPLEKLNGIAEYIQQSEEAKVHALEELDKVKEQASLHAGRLADACAYNKSLEAELSEAEKHISFIFEEKNAIQLGKVSVEQELEKLKEESSSSAIKLSEAYATVKTFEGALAKAQMDITQLNTDKTQMETKSEHEVFELNAKLNECRVELAGARGSLESYSAELNSHLQHLLMIIMDESQFFVIAEQFSKKIEGLKKINSIIQNMHHQFASKGLHIHPSMEHDPTFGKFPSLPKFEDFANNWVIPFASDSEDAPSLTMIVGGLRARAELFDNYFEVFCKGLEEHISSIFQAVQVTNKKLVHVLELNESLILDVHKLEAHNKAQAEKLSCLEKEMMRLFSACNDTTRDLTEFCDLRDPASALEKEKFSGGTEDDTDSYANAADSLFLAAKRIKNQFQKLSNAEEVWLTSLDEMKNKLEEAELIAKTATEKRMINQERVHTLERDLEASNELCHDLKVKLKNYQAKEDTLRVKEELLSMQHTLDKGLSGQQLSESQINFLLDKVSKTEITSINSAKSHPEVDLSDPVEKLCFIVDIVIDMQQKMDILTYEKEDMQLTLVSQMHEIESLKEAAEANYTKYQELELRKNELLDMNDDLERIVKKLGGYNPLQDQKPLSAKLLLTVLERLTTASTLESENLKSRAQELGAKLQAKDGLIHELSGKIKLLEDSIHARSKQQEITKERTVFEATPTTTDTEISEIEDVGPLGKNTKTAVSTAAQLRTMRKGSTDHFILNIDAGSDRSVAALETADKGHVFKSLNTSGVIPKQGKLIADRVDGIWVSGGQLLMRKPGARLGLMAYVFFMHLWLLGTIL